MKEFFPRQEFQRMGFSEPAIRLLERLTDIKEIGLRAAAMEQALGTIAEGQAATVPALELTDTAIASAVAFMSDIAPVTIAADYAGTVDPSTQLPLNVAAKRYYGAEEVTTASAWSATDTGSITYTIGAATGIVNITAIAASSVITVTSVHNGLSLSRQIVVTKQLASPPATGSGGGTSASDTTFATINSASMAAISDELTITTGSVGTITMSASLKVHTAAASPDGVFEVFGIWQWWDGASWIDQGTEVASGTDSTVFLDEGVYYNLPKGQLDVPASKTGLLASTSYKVRLQARNSSGTRVMSFSGTATAVGS